MCSRRGDLEGTLNGNLQIWSLSPPIPHGLLFGRLFRGQTLGFRQPAERVGIRWHSSFWGLLCDIVFMPRSQVPTQRSVIKVKCLPAWRPGGKAAFPLRTSDWCKRSAPFPKRELWPASDASRLITRFVMGLPRARESRRISYLLRIRLNHWSRSAHSIWTVVQSGPLLPPPAC